MNKVLVTVDFSANSRKTIRFAIQLASKSRAELVFFHMISLIQPTSDAVWDYMYYTPFQDEALEQSKKHLAKLIKEVYI